MSQNPTEKSKDLNLYLSIYGDKQFFSEKQILDSLPKIKNMVESGSIRLLVTDGIVSINYMNEELLGEEYWDDVHLILNDIFYRLGDLINGKEIECFLPMNSIWIKLKLNEEMITYTLRPSQRRHEKTGQADLERQIPKKLFIHEFIHFYLRSVRILAAMGENARTFDEFTHDDDIEDVLIGHNFKHVFQDWRKYIPPNILSDEELAETQALMDMPLGEWITKCGG
jgi:hypothetical protein